MLVFACERSGEYKAPKKKLKLEDKSSRKYGCLFRLHAYLKKENNECWLAILNEVHTICWSQSLKVIFLWVG